MAPKEMPRVHARRVVALPIASYVAQRPASMPLRFGRASMRGGGAPPSLRGSPSVAASLVPRFGLPLARGTPRSGGRRTSSPSLLRASRPSLAAALLARVVRAGARYKQGSVVISSLPPLSLSRRPRSPVPVAIPGSFPAAHANCAGRLPPPSLCAPRASVQSSSICAWFRSAHQGATGRLRRPVASTVRSAKTTEQTSGDNSGITGG